MPVLSPKKLPKVIVMFVGQQLLAETIKNNINEQLKSIIMDTVMIIVQPQDYDIPMVEAAPKPKANITTNDTAIQRSMISCT